ncbi:unnamed protein product [Sympodiomycopsis kandeliae]
MSASSYISSNSVQRLRQRSPAGIAEGTKVAKSKGPDRPETPNTGSGEQNQSWSRNEEICQWFGPPEAAIDKAHLVLHSELFYSRLFVSSRSVGLSSCGAEESVKERLLPSNIVRLGETLQAVMTDGAAAARKDPNLAMFPSSEDLRRAVRLAEEERKNQEAEWTSTLRSYYLIGHQPLRMMTVPTAYFDLS